MLSRHGVQLQLNRGPGIDCACDAPYEQPYRTFSSDVGRYARASRPLAPQSGERVGTGIAGLPPFHGVALTAPRLPRASSRASSAWRAPVPTMLMRR